MSNFDIGARLAALERQVARMQRSTRLSHASLEDTALQVYDQDGSLRAIIGQQEDGTSGVTVVNGPPPPQPAAPTVLPSLSGVAVAWTGTFTDAVAAPLDFARVEIHTTAAPDTPLGTATLKATLESPRGGTVLVTAAQPVYVRLVARNTSGTASVPSAAAGPVGPAAVVAEDVLDGIINEAKLADEAVGRMKLQIGAVGYNQLGIGTGNLIPDPSFEGPLTTNLIATNTAWTFTDGNRSARALRVSATAPAASMAIQLTEIPLSPGDRFFCAFDARVSADWNADSLRCYFRWYDAAGATLGYGITKATPVPGGAWTRYSSQQQAPAGVARAAVWLSNFPGTGTAAGTGDFDNVEVKTVVGAGMVLADSIGTPELIAGSVTAEIVAAKTLTAREVKALSLTGNEMAANTLTANHIKAGTLSADRLALGVDGNVIGDPSFEGEVSVQRVAGDANWSVVTPGSTTPKAVRVNAAAATATSRTLTLATLPVLPGQKVYLSVDYLADAAWAGASVNIFAQWLDGTGTSLGYSTMNAATGGGVVRGTWTTLAGVPANASPANTTSARVCLESLDSTAGTVTFDNAECRMVVASGSEGARAELSPLGMRLYDEDGEEALALVTGSPNYVTLRTAGESVATIDQAGVASFQSLNVADGLTWRGDDLTTFLNLAPRGIQAIDYQVTGVTATGTEMGFVELAFDAEADRMYRVVFDAYADPSVAGGEVVVYLRDGGTKSPTITSPQIQSVTYPMPTAGSRRVRLEDLRHGQGWVVGTHHLLISFKNQAAPAGATVRMQGGNSYRGFLYVEDVGGLVLETGRYNTGGGSTTDPPPTTPAPKKYVKTYGAIWSGSYARRAGYNSYYGNQMLQGYYSSTNGTQASLVGFGGSLSSDLSGATINKAELYLYFAHWYSNAGGKAVIKAHGLTSRPSTFSSDSEAMTVSWARNQGKWVDITAIFDSTKWRGIALDPNSTSSTYYGRATGVGEGNPPQLRVTYTK
ncbi:hypothetical protein [Streptomyces sp. H27-C3]|uniref:hypothetical protein n=1 Tax=Streptomyces sp. H27-C3 TaxID=3046305 RepID=UPI0024BB09E9|nr:hypothetical protein [Streptomyces sp. H27-C3]MDJ0464976.1 hypothetical protein [Streptomyces sp. H27-C3]